MNRQLRFAAWGYIGLCALTVTAHRGRARPRTFVPVAPVAPVAPVGAAPRGSDAAEWFDRVKPYCNAVEVDVRLRADPAPVGTTEGAGYGAACYALAGKLSHARETLEALAPSERTRAAGIVFEVGHPVADAGDDASAGPIMRLVIEYQPDNYMALYHAGMSEYALGASGLARTHLSQFLRLYAAEDGWRASARSVLERLGAAPLPE